MKAIKQNDIIDVIYDGWYGLPLEEADKVVCDCVHKKMIPIEWIKKYIEDNTVHAIDPKYNDWYFTEEPIDYHITFYPVQVVEMLNKWERENETV